MKRILTIALIITCFQGYSQSNKRKAFQTFKKARNAYFDNNYKEASNLFRTTIDELGQTNVQIQSLYVLSLNELEDWKLLEEQVPIYFNLPYIKANKNYSKIDEIKNNLNRRLSEEKDFYLKVKALKSVTEYKAFLRKYPNSKYSDEIQKELDNLEEEILWERSLLKNSVFSMENYLESTKLYKYKGQAEAKIDKWDDEAVLKAKKLDTQTSYREYLNEFQSGKYISEISKLLELKIEDDLYEEVVAQNTVTSFERYLRAYPEGRYSDQANSSINKILIQRIELQKESKSYSELQRTIDEYRDKFPNSPEIKRLEKLHRKAERNLKKRNSGYFAFTYEGNESVGLQFGSLRKKNLGWYFSARATTNILDASFDRGDNNVTTQEEIEQFSIDFETIYASATFGLTYPIAYPIYVSAGAGVNYLEYFTEDVNDEPSSFFIESEESYSIFPEASLIFKLRPLTIIGGASYIRDEVIYKVGIGFTF